MSEYQYYEFQAIDRPLGETVQAKLRATSTRARITSTSFTNHYEWGDFRGDPRRLMERWFDLHLYLANWGTRRLMIRLPKRVVERSRLDAFLSDVDWVEVWENGDNLVVDMHRDEVEAGYDDWDDGSGWLAALAPLRADLLAGDLRLFYLLWMTSLENGVLEKGASEPLSGIGPLTGALEAAVGFFGIDRHLVHAAAERDGDSGQNLTGDSLCHIIAELPEAEKSALLLRVAQGDPHVGADLRRTARNRQAGPATEARTAAAIITRAAEIRNEIEQEETKRRVEEHRRKQEKAKQEQRKRLDTLKQRGEAVWEEIETEINRRNATGYDRAAMLLFDLRRIAEENRTEPDFLRHVREIRKRHGKKKRFIERLNGLA